MGKAGSVVAVPDPSKENAFNAEVDFPRILGCGAEATGERWECHAGRGVYNFETPSYLSF